MIRLRAPAQQAKPGPPLSPILGQHQVKIAEFVTQFNQASAGYAPGTPLGVRIHKEGTKFTLRVCPPSFGLLLRGVTPLSGGGRLSREDLWGVLRFRFGKPRPFQVRTVLGSLRSLGLELR